MLIYNKREQAVTMAKLQANMRACIELGDRLTPDDPKNNYIIYSGGYYKHNREGWLELITVNLFRMGRPEDVFVTTVALRD